jgi:transcriptional regulator with XRE-family HTH domain
MTTKKKHYEIKDFEAEFGELTFGQALESYRIGLEMSLADFSKILKISPSSLSDLEKGRRIPSLDRCKKIAKYIKEPLEFWAGLVLKDQISKAGLDQDIEVMVYKKAS